MHVVQHLLHAMRRPPQYRYVSILYLDVVEVLRLAFLQHNHLNFRTDGTYAGLTTLMLVCKAELKSLSSAENMRLLQFLIHMGADVSYVNPRGDNAVIMAAASANTVAWNKLQRLPATSL